ncbi:hypothetical protein ACIQAL_12890, partial [Pseudomonas sp. NPDC088368]|uniref:hypothetical protein n=1 Tax=Pseudomonas sp. NPDC088368 TaxID=3364453 RepID=UPI0038001888
ACLRSAGHRQQNLTAAIHVTHRMHRICCRFAPDREQAALPRLRQKPIAGNSTFCGGSNWLLILAEGRGSATPALPRLRQKPIAGNSTFCRGSNWLLILAEGRGSWLAYDLPGTGSKT